MYPKLKDKKIQLKRIIGNYMYEIKNALYEFIKISTDWKYLVLFLRKNFHF